MIGCNGSYICAEYIFHIQLGHLPGDQIPIGAGLPGHLISQGDALGLGGDVDEAAVHALFVAAGRDVLHMSTLSPDETYRYIIQRENELTMIPQREAYERIIRASSCQNDRKTER